MIARLHIDHSSESGAVLLLVAVALFAVIGIAAVAIETGHWYVHKRHLQLQADAAALAGATAFNHCVADATAGNAAIVAYAHQYGGDPSPPSGYTPAYNTQVSNSTNVIVNVNSDTYGSAGTDNTPDGPPCSVGYVDVKATETDLPWFSFFSGVVPEINTHARVSILQLDTLSGALPLAVEDVNPLQVGALFVNEDSGNAVLGRLPLSNGAPTTLNGQTLTPWSGGPVSVSVASAHTGVVIALCSNRTLCPRPKPPAPANTAWLMSGSLAGVCAQIFVTCVKGSGSAPGLQFIRGYNSGGSGSAGAPIVRSVTLTSGTCTDDSSPYFILNGGCRVGVQAAVDFGVTGDPSRPISAGGLNASVSVGSCNLAYTGSSGTTSSWAASSCHTLASGAGQVPLNLNWSTGQGSGKVSGSVTEVVRPFANNGPDADQSYPVAFSEISEGTSCSTGFANSVPTGTHDMCVGVGVIGSLQNAADVSDPTRILKFIGGSHTGAIDCGAVTLREDIISGCSTPVQVNEGELCPNSTIEANCLPLRTGAKVGQVRQGMNDRFALSGTCPANNWSAPTGSLPDIPQGDPRVVPMIITLFSAFAGSGGGYVPVTDFATFYVTGWDGAIAACDGINESAPAGAGNGTIWGHFIKYVGDLGPSTGGATCDLSVSSLRPCITVMTE
jgi:Putative Flp pilus-assembly TadE/G-like